MVTPQLLEYIRAQQEQGVPLPAVHDALITAGWAREDVEEALTQFQPPAPVSSTQQAPVTLPSQPENVQVSNGVPLAQSSDGPNGPFPQELKGWNWGAFFLSWIWGVGNNVLISLLVFLPFIGFVIIIVLGVNGNKLAWHQRKFESIEQFRSVQRKWAIWGVGLFIATVILSIILGILGMK